MTLSARVSVVLLATLAVALAGLSAGAHVLTRSALEERVDERLDAAIDTLDALVESGPAGLEWETEDRAVTIGSVSGPDEVVWVVHDERERRVAASANVKSLDPALGASLDACVPTAMNSRSISTVFDGDGHAWRRLCVRRRTASATGSGARLPESPAERPDASTLHQELDLVAQLSLRPVERAARAMLLGAVAVSMSILLVVALVARRLVRRALAPLSSTAASADAITAADLRRRLPVLGTKDELDRLTTSFNDLLARVEQAYATQRRLAADASHQLRTPLTALVGQIEVTLRRDRSPEMYRESLVKALERARHMSGIVEGLLLLARVETEGGRPEAEDVDCSAWLGEHVARLADRPRHADMTVETPDEGLTVRASPAWLAQVLDALIENASKYSREGTPITLRAHRVGPDVALTVEDRGMGMTEEDRRRVFEPFFRAAAVRHDGPPGMGLGLSIAARLADAMGGRIDVRSEPGAGSAFTLVLPAAQNQSSDPERS